MGQQHSQPPSPPPLQDYQTGTDLDSFPILDHYRDEFDDEICDHNEKILTIYAISNARQTQKVTQLRLGDLDEANYLDGVSTLRNELPLLYYAAGSCRFSSLLIML